MVEISRRLVPTYAGIRLVPDPTMVDLVEDWSDVRSPGRAARRRRQGHPQRIRTRWVPKPEILHLEAQGMMVAHPTVIDAILARARDRLEATRESQMMDALLGRGRW